MTRPPSRESSGESSDEGPATNRDLIAQARRMLPPEVDVVALVSGAALAGAVALGGCGSPAGGADPAASKAHVVARATDLLGRLTAVGTYQRPPRAGWSGCDDLGGQVAYRVSGRIDAASGSPAGFLDEVRRTFHDAGFALTEVSATPDPVTLQGEHDDVRVQLTGYATQPVVLLALTGPCLDVGEDDETLLAEPPERLDLR